MATKRGDCIADNVSMPEARARSRPGSHWLSFFLLVAIAFLLDSAGSGNWARAAGYVAVPAAVGYFIVRGGRGLSGLVLHYCSAHGATPADAVREVQIAIEAWLAVAREHGQSIPEPGYRPKLADAA